MICFMNNEDRITRNIPNHLEHCDVKIIVSSKISTVLSPGGFRKVNFIKADPIDCMASLKTVLHFFPNWK